MKPKLSLFSLVMLIVAAIGSVRTLPITAFFGSSLIAYFLFAAVLFLFPIALISAEFSSRYVREGGVFHWVGKAFSDRVGVFAVWLQWINTMIWYPTMLLFIAGTAAHLIDPSFAENKFFLLGVVLVVFWGLTLLNLRGIQVSARLNGFCGLAGTLVPMAILISLGAWWVLAGHPVAIDVSKKALLPSFHAGDTGGALITIMASLVGMELSGVYVKEIDRPERNFPKAIAYSVLILLSTLILGSLSVAIVIPHDEIRFVDGVMQTFSAFLHAFQVPFLIPVLSFLIILGSIGGSINWLLSPASGLLQVAEHGFLPPFFLKKNKHGAPVRILVGQAGVVTVFCFLMQWMPSLNSYYWFLMALSTSLYMLMYALVFLGALKLGRPQEISSGYKIPPGLRSISCILGLIGCMMTMVIGFQPAAGISVGSSAQYMGSIALGYFLMLSPVVLLWRYKNRRIIWNQSL